MTSSVIHKTTEKEFEAQVKHLAERVFGWRYYHTWRSIHSPAGFPDCVLVHREKKRVIFAELKSETGKTTPAQDEWLTDLAECNQEVYLWRPSDIEEIAEVLR